jgi:hypothetical protein
MTNYNERLNEILVDKFEEIRVIGCTVESIDRRIAEAKQAITSLTKELVAEAKPYRETIIDKWNKDRADEVKATNAAMNAWADIFEHNLLKALEEK